MANSMNSVNVIDNILGTTNRSTNSLSVSDTVSGTGMTSLEIAEVTGKQHKNVMRDIRELLEQGVNQLNFEPVEYTDKKGEKRPCYRLTPKGCLILASGYDALLREKIINRLETLEKNNKPQLPGTYLDALKQLVASEEQKQQLALENKRQAQEIEVKDAQITELNTAVSKMQPKVSYVDMVLQCKSTILVTTIAQDYGKSAKAFNILLRNLGIQHKVGTSWILYSKYISCGYVQSEPVEITRTNGTKTIVYNTKWTQKGRFFLYNLLKEHGILPIIEQNN